MPPFAIIIPARFASSRFPGKPLVQLAGATGVRKTLIERSYRAAQAVPGCAFLAVATDDDRIAECARGFGAAVVMTPESCANGTERCAAAAAQISQDIDIVVNLQGDAPLTPAWFITAIVERIAGDRDIGVATPAVRASPAVHLRLLEDQAAGRVGGTTAVVSSTGRALYFSKAVLPRMPDAMAGRSDVPVLLHVGAYAYRRAALARYAATPVSTLEVVEGLEQLRFLAADEAVGLVEVDARGCELWELNNPEDVTPIELQLSRLGFE